MDSIEIVSFEKIRRSFETSDHKEKQAWLEKIFSLARNGHEPALDYVKKILILTNDELILRNVYNFLKKILYKF